MTTHTNLKLGLALFAFGFIGIVSALPFIPMLLALQPTELPMPVFVLQILSIVRSSVILAACVALGLACAPKVDLDAPLIRGYIEQRRLLPSASKTLLPGILGGLIGGVIILVFASITQPLLPASFIANAEYFVPPWYTKLLYGGITEEVLVRWGFMSFFVWLFSRINHKSGEPLRVIYYFLGIVSAAFLFGLLHLPAASLLSSEVTPALIAYIIIANSIFGVIAGWLFWRYGLECAVLGHMFCHITMIFFGA